MQTCLVQQMAINSDKAEVIAAFSDDDDEEDDDEDFDKFKSSWI